MLCEAENDDEEETTVIQERGTRKYKKKLETDNQFTEEGTNHSRFGPSSKDQEGGGESLWTRRFSYDGNDETTPAGKRT